MTTEIRNLLKEARTIIRAHARWTAKDWDERATKALAIPPQRTEQTSAERTLQSLGYINNGGEYWKPPLGKQPSPQRTEEKNT
jgi:hypothetical protein